MKMPFGPYKGTDTKLLPEQYVIDLYNTPTLTIAVRWAIKDEIVRRGLIAAKRTITGNPDYRPPEEITGYDLAMTAVRDFRSQHISS